MGANPDGFEPLPVTEHDRPTDLTEALLDLAGLAAQILSHMARWQGHSPPDAPPPEQVFRELLSETLREVLERRPPADIEAARRVVVDAIEQIEAEILLVEPPRRRSMSRRRPRPD